MLGGDDETLEPGLQGFSDSGSECDECSPQDFSDNDFRLNFVDIFENGSILKHVLRRGDDKRRPGRDQPCQLSYKVWFPPETFAQGLVLPWVEEERSEHMTSAGSQSTLSTIFARELADKSLPCRAKTLQEEFLCQVLQTMRRGERAIFQCKANKALRDDVVIRNLLSDNLIRVEIELHEFREMKDVSFEQDGTVMKLSLRSRDTWPECHDAGRCTLKVTSVLAAGVEHLTENGCQTLSFRLGDGEVCDALECAATSMRLGEIAVVHCSLASLCNEPKLGLVGCSDVDFHIHLVDYSEPSEEGSFNVRTGAFVCAFDARKRFSFLLTRKEHAVQLLRCGRFTLAAERFRRIYELLGYIDIVKDVSGKRVGMQASHKEKVAELRKQCLLNRALSLLKDQKFTAVVRTCDIILETYALETKALLRRSRSHLSLGNYYEAVRDARTVLHIDPSDPDARRLLAEVKAQSTQENDSAKFVSVKMCAAFGSLPHPMDVD